MLLISLNRVDRNLPKEAVARITSSGAPLLGVVTNAIKPEQKWAPMAMAMGLWLRQIWLWPGYGYGYAASPTVPRPMPTTRWGK